MMLEFLFRDTRCLIRESGCKEKIAWNHTDYSILNPDRKGIRIYIQGLII